LRLSGYPKGDILVFMTGQEDIDAVCFLLQERLEELIADGAKVAELEILPIHRWAVEVTADGEERGERGGDRARGASADTSVLGVFSSLRCSM